MIKSRSRALGGWQAEWDTLPEILRLSAGALRQLGDVAAGLNVDAARMRANLDATHGQIMAEAVTLALGAGIGRMAAHELVERACRAASESGRHLRDVLKQDPQISAHLGEADIDRLLDPAGYTGAAAAFVERVLETHRQQRQQDRRTIGNSHQE